MPSRVFSQRKLCVSASLCLYPPVAPGLVVSGCAKQIYCMPLMADKYAGLLRVLAMAAHSASTCAACAS